MKLLTTGLLLVISVNSFSQDARTEPISEEHQQNILFERAEMHILDLNLSGLSTVDQQILKDELYRFNNYIISIELDELNNSLCFKHKKSLPKTSVLLFLEDREISSGRIVNY